jgi:hypothetical protein
LSPISEFGCVSVGNSWIIDSGATTHMCNDKGQFENLKRITPTSVTLGDGKSLESAGVGEVPINLKLSSGKIVRCKLQGVLWFGI